MIRAYFALAAVALAACSSSSPSSPGSDAGPDVGVDSAPPPYTPVGPLDDSGSGNETGALPFGADGGLSAQCATLQDAVNTAAHTAAACNPSQVSPTQTCYGETPGICCPITVSLNTDPSLVDDLNAAIAAYKSAGCPVSCTSIACETTPSKICVGTGTTGVCQ